MQKLSKMLAVCTVTAGISLVSCEALLNGTSQQGTGNTENRGGTAETISEIGKPLRIPVYPGSLYDQGRGIGSGITIVEEKARERQAPLKYLEFTGTSELTMANTEETTISGTGSRGVFVSNRTVRLSPYALGKYEVTRGLYRAVMNHLAETLNAEYLKGTSSQWTNIGNVKDSNNRAIKIQSPYAQYLSPDNPNNPSRDTYYDARAFLEYMGFDSPDGINFWYEDHLGAGLWQGTARDRLTAEYFNPAHDNEPLGYIQWYEAVIFTNYLSILTGKIPAYDLHDGLDYDSQYAGSTFGTNEDRWKKEMAESSPPYQYPQGYNPLYLYYYNTQTNETVSVRLGDESTAASLRSQDTDWEVKARRNPVSWMLSQRWLLTIMKNPDSYAREYIDNGGNLQYEPLKGKSREWRPGNGLRNGLHRSSNNYSLQDVARNGRFTFDRTANAYRLPTEAEWEFAARGGAPSSSEDAPWNARYAGTNNLEETAFGSPILQVGSSPANPLDLHEMSGSMAEWVWDLKGGEENTNPHNPNTKADLWNLQYPQAISEEIDPQGAVSDVKNNVYLPIKHRYALLERVIRGGSWNDLSLSAGDRPITGSMPANASVDELHVLTRSTFNKYIVQTAENETGGRWRWRGDQERASMERSSSLMGLMGKSTIGLRLAQTVEP